jgi:hypothetical protein
MTHEEAGRTIVATISNPGTTVTKTMTIESTVSGMPTTKTEIGATTQPTKSSYETASSTTIQATTAITGLETFSSEFMILAVIVANGNHRGNPDNTAGQEVAYER